MVVYVVLDWAFVVHGQLLATRKSSSEGLRRMTDNTVGTRKTNGPSKSGDHAPCSCFKLFPLASQEKMLWRVSVNPTVCSSFSLEDTIPKKVVCHFSGKTYADEERWDIDSCTHCYCLQGQTLCSTVSCPPLPCAEPIKVEGSCCPMCPGIQTIPPLLPSKYVPSRGSARWKCSYTKTSG